MRKLLILLIAVTLLLGYQSGASAWDESWDFSAPSGTVDSGTLDTVIQDTKKSFAERLNQDHWFVEDNDEMNDLTAGDHRHVTMLEKGSAPSHAANTGILYTIADGADTELGYTDAGGNDLQITVDGGLNLSGGYSITDLTISNSLSVGNDVTVTDDISAGGDITSSGQIWMGSSLVSTGMQQATGSVLISSTGNVSETGVGFQPSAIIFMGLENDSGAGDNSVGLFTADNQYSSNNSAYNANYRGSTSNSSIIGYSNASKIWEFDYVSMDADGFTINVSDADANYTVYYLALK